jgi:hypothetical protein
LTRAALVLPLLIVALAACVVEDDAEESAPPQAAPFSPTETRVIVRDDFSDPNSGWYTGNDETSEVKYSNGRYHVLMKRDEQTSDSFSIDEVVEGMRVEVDVVQAAGTDRDDMGVVCYAHVGAEKNAGYALVISPGTRWAGIYRELEGDSSSLEQRSDEDVIRPPLATNRLRADCIGSRRGAPAVISLYVNGRLVARAEDDDGFPRFDGVGVTTASNEGGTKVVYDNVVVRELR